MIDIVVWARNQMGNLLHILMKNTHHFAENITTQIKDERKYVIEK